MRGAGLSLIVSAQIPAINCIIKYYQLKHAAGNLPPRDLRPKDQAFFFFDFSKPGNFASG
jgi:hypothetical protein